MKSKKKSPILIVGDIVDYPDGVEIPLLDSDNPFVEEVAEIKSWIEQAGYEVRTQSSVRDFISKVSSYNDFIVFPLWRAGFSRNRTSIVPAVCEANEILYVGSDTFVQSVCQDKSLSKDCCRKVGIDVPNELVIYSLEELQSISFSKHFKSQFVIKPLFSACSIGINNNSLCLNDIDAKEKVKELFMLGLSPVICEEFIVGEEISLCFLEEQGKITQKCVSAFIDENGNCPFYNRLYTFEDKMNESPSWSFASKSYPIDISIWHSAELLIQQFGKVDYMRIDGKLRNDKFVLIELTPDINLSPTSTFVSAFNSIGINPTNLFDMMIETALRNYSSKKIPLHL